MRPVNELIDKKRAAVRLRLGGASLAQVRAQTGLSVPTIVKAVDLFKRQGWKGLEPEARGRKPSVVAETPKQEAMLIQVIQACTERLQRFCCLDDLLEEYAQHYKAISKKTLLRRLNRLVPEIDHSAVFAAMGRFVDNAEAALGSQDGLEPQTVDLLARSRRLVLGFHLIGNGCLFYTQDRRGERRFVYYQKPVHSTQSLVLSETSLVEQLTLLASETSPQRPFFVVIKTDSLSRYQQLAAWQKANKDRCFLFAQWALPD